MGKPQPSTSGNAPTTRRQSLQRPVSRRYFVRVVKGSVTGIARPSENDTATIRQFQRDPAWQEVSRDRYLQAKGAIEGFNAR